MKYLLLFLLILTVQQAAAQRELEKADREYKALKYRNAIPLYLRALKKDPSHKTATARLAESLYKIHDYGNALTWYASAVNMDAANNTLWLPYAQLLASEGKYTEAASWYEKYLGVTPGDSVAQAFLYTYKHIDQLLDSSRWTIGFLNINTGYDEFSPSWFNNGLLFVSNRPRTTAAKRTFEWDRTPFLSLYEVHDTNVVKIVPAPPRVHTKIETYEMSYRGTGNDSRKLSAASPEVRLKIDLPEVPKESVAPFNKQLETKYHEGPVTFNPAGDTIFMSRNNIFKNRTGKDKEGVNRLKIYSAVFRYGDWKNFTEFTYNSNDYSVAHPAMTPDGQVLFFVSDKPGGLGGSDIWYCVRTPEGWSEPENAGPTVNTPGNEMFPYVSKAGQLYFSSDGRGGLGGMDIFLVSLHDNQPTGAAANLGAPMNSPKDDFGVLLFQNGYMGYFSSNRGGTDDLYYFMFNGPGYPKGVVFTPAQASTK